MNCPECGSQSYCKNGFSGYNHLGNKETNRKQRYRCLLCGYNYTVPEVSTGSFKNWGYSQDKWLKACELYEHHLSSNNGKPFNYRAIAKKLGEVSYSTVRNWIKAYQKLREE